MTTPSRHSKRALLLFVRDERRESTIKPLPGRYRKGGYAALNRSIIARLDPLVASGVELVIARETAADVGAPAVLQRGGTFGERIANAIDDTFALGYETVVAIGNDCPTISPDDVAAAFSRLEAGASIVAAPSRDGGAYLIGARAGAVDFERFRSLPWQTRQLFSAILSLGGAIAFPVLREDFDSWQSGTARRALKRLLPELAAHAATVLPPSHPPVARLHKALTRSFLPAPPIA